MTGAKASGRSTAVERTPSAVRCYVCVLLGLCVLVVILGALPVLDALGATVVWAVAIGLASALSLPVLPRLRFEVDLSTPVIVAAGILLPPPATLAAAFLGYGTHRMVRRDAPGWSLLFNKSQIALSAVLASLAAGQWTDQGGPEAVLVVVAAVVGAAVYEVANTLFVAGFFALRSRAGPRQALQAVAAPFPHFATTTALVALLAVPIVLAAPELGAWSVLLMALPLALGWSALESARESQERADRLAEQVGELQMLNELGQQLLPANDAASAQTATEQALGSALGREVRVSLTGDLDEELEVVKVVGAEPAAVGVPRDLPEGSHEVVEATARLLGVILQRLELSDRLADLQRGTGRALPADPRRWRARADAHRDAHPRRGDPARRGGRHPDRQRPQRAGRRGVRSGRAPGAGRPGRARHQHRQAPIDAAGDPRADGRAPADSPAGSRTCLRRCGPRHGLEVTLQLPEEPLALPLPIEIMLVETSPGDASRTWSVTPGRAACTSSSAPTALGVCLKVADDGVGFDPATRLRSGRGLTLMLQRVELARGTPPHRLRPG